MHAATGVRQPKSSNVKGIGWNGARAAIGATYYSPDLPGTCAVEEVNAANLDKARSAKKLQEYLRCAALLVETLGYFAWPVLSRSSRWNHGATFVFGVNAETGAVEFGGSESMFAFSGRIPELLDGRDLVKATAEFGETFSYYDVANPETAGVEPRMAFVKLVQTLGELILVGSAYDPTAVSASK